VSGNPRGHRGDALPLLYDVGEAVDDRGSAVSVVSGKVSRTSAVAVIARSIAAGVVAARRNAD
jgi:hypothetical protein